MQENDNAPRRHGCASRNERRAWLTSSSCMYTRGLLRGGWRSRRDSVDLRIHSADGQRYRLNEIAYQQWRGGKIVHEKFYYDPAQRQLQSPVNREITAIGRHGPPPSFPQPPQPDSGFLSGLALVSGRGVRNLAWLSTAGSPAWFQVNVPSACMRRAFRLSAR